MADARKSDCLKPSRSPTEVPLDDGEVILYNTEIQYYNQSNIVGGWELLKKCDPSTVSWDMAVYCCEISREMSHIPLRVCSNKVSGVLYKCYSEVFVCVVCVSCTVCAAWPVWTVQEIKQRIQTVADIMGEYLEQSFEILCPHLGLYLHNKNYLKENKIFSMSSSRGMSCVHLSPSQNKDNILTLRTPLSAVCVGL